MITTAQALSGPWAANVRGGIVTSVLASVLVVSQEIATPLPGPGWIAISVLLQAVASVAWVAVVAGVSRTRFGRVVPVASGLIWVGIGVCRGVVGGLIAFTHGLDPEWLYRIGFWILVSTCWMPLLTYALAQWEEHRRLLARRAVVAMELDAATARAAESADETASRLRAAVDDALSPALDEIRAQLRGRTVPDATAAAAIASRLDELAARTAGFAAAVAVPAPVRAVGRVSVSAASREFELRRPVFAAALSAVATAPLVVPEAYRVGGWWHATEVVIAIAASTAVLIGAFAILRPRHLSGAQRSILSRTGVVLAGVVGSGVLATLSAGSGRPGDVVLLLIFPLVVATAASTIATAVALASTNVELDARAVADSAALDDLRMRALVAEAEAAARLEILIRGDVNGRVASCALALAVLAGGDVTPAARTRIVEGVLSQLDAAAAELRGS
ncbi:hypothetical protein [Pseudolysinimonas sp.]|uniref:hypothetical protein n=1 Tax=Pseudolysinimonas sp. TaxID=2680009 RepID=UPI003783E866